MLVVITVIYFGKLLHNRLSLIILKWCRHISFKLIHVHYFFQSNVLNQCFVTFLAPVPLKILWNVFVPPWATKPVLVNLFRSRTHFQLILKSLYTPVVTTQCIEFENSVKTKKRSSLPESLIFSPSSRWELKKGLH